jgi:hypothetical protein
MTVENNINLLSVGDTLITNTFLGSTRFPITRVTKKLALSKRESDGYEHKFKRNISINMSHPNVTYSSTEYFVIRKKLT